MAAERLANNLEATLQFPQTSITDLAKELFLQRLSEGLLTRDENPQSHLCVYFAAVDPAKKEIFIGHHKKADLWLFNGGHIDLGETPSEAFFREISEEWGDLDEIGLSNLSLPNPGLLTITHIDSEVRPCRTHYDIWHFVNVDKDSFQPKPEKLAEEFYEAKWIPLAGAQSLVTDPATLEAIEYLQTL